MPSAVGLPSAPEMAFHEAWPLRSSAADHHGDAPALDERSELDLPALGELAQNGRQLVQPPLDLGSEPPPETPPELSVEFRDASLAHRPTSRRISRASPAHTRIRARVEQPVRYAATRW